MTTAPTQTTARPSGGNAGPGERVSPPSTMISRLGGSAVPRPTLRVVGAGCTLLGLFVLGFVGYLYGISGLQEARAQRTLYATLRLELSNQVAPLAATTPGAPVAIVNIPEIGISKMIVVEGTSPSNLMLGPGHLPDTPMPGEFGVSMIFGRRATFGAPFGRLTELRNGDRITVITGQGKASYTVVARGDSRHVVEDPAPNRLLVFTTCSAVVPASYCYYDADLTSAPQQDPGGRPALTTAEEPLNGDTSVLVVTMMWGLALVIISAAGTIAAVRWSPWLAYLAAAPLAFAVLWNLYQNLAALLPNLY